MDYKELMTRFAQSIAQSVAIAALACFAAMTVSGCDRSAQTPPASPSSSVLPSATPVTPAPIDSDSATPSPTASNAVDQVTVTVYETDSQCENLVPQQVQVSGDRPIEGAVGKVLENFSTVDFPISGYRVKVDNGIATVDLRLPANASRKMISLSSCEQFALFGSLRETLLKNPDWGIQEVKFTERGEAIAL
jgi:hypothetical protein